MCQLWPLQNERKCSSMGQGKEIMLPVESCAEFWMNRDTLIGNHKLVSPLLKTRPTYRGYLSVYFGASTDWHFLLAYVIWLFFMWVKGWVSPRRMPRPWKKAQLCATDLVIHGNHHFKHCLCQWHIFLFFWENNESMVVAVSGGILPSSVRWFY